MDAELFKKILIDSILPDCRALCGRGYKIAWDQDSKHTSSVVKSFLNSRHVTRLEGFPPSSPDINPIEQIWGILKQALKAYRSQGSFIYDTQKYDFHTTFVRPIYDLYTTTNDTNTTFLRPQHDTTTTRHDTVTTLYNFSYDFTRPSLNFQRSLEFSQDLFLYGIPQEKGYLSPLSILTLFLYNPIKNMFS